ncbi:hypothetical protein [Streptomyces shenzhenensis]|uniref:hypothetical protein n=1 Tax=Streptomyces shenzhenensis TaxID=943815 RepID=UPI0015F088B4|nr:hypothetical protein [Streptomyces shenzhenensis]
MRIIYCAVSTRLAVFRPSTFPHTAWWLSTRPAVHRTHAVASDSDLLARELLLKCRTARGALDQGPADMAGTAWDSVWPGPVLWWVSRLDRQKPSTDPVLAPRTLSIALQTLVDWLHQNGPERRSSALCLWFAEESVHLAELGGYPNPARNDVDPLSHLEWCIAQRPISAIRDLLSKSQEQFHLQKKKGSAAETAFCSDILARAMSWSSLPASLLPQGAPLTGVPAHWSAWCEERCRRHGDDSLWRTVDRVIRASAIALVQQERELEGVY